MLPLALLAAALPQTTIPAAPGADGWGKHVADLGDVDGDSVPDLAVASRDDDGVWIVSGATGTATPLNVDLGRPKVSGLLGCDVTGDGVAEVVVASQVLGGGSELFIEAYQIASGAEIWEYYDFQFVGEDEVRMLVLGDATGDGIDDVLFGVPDYDLWHPAWWESGVGILDGEDGRLVGGVAISDFPSRGEGLAVLDDMNGDGVPEFAFGQPQAGWITSFGEIRTIALGTPPSQGPFWALTGASDGTELGEALATIGDVDGDGYRDLVTLVSVGPGFADLALRQISGATGATIGERTFRGEAYPGIAHEAELAGLGDVDGDGVADLAITSPAPRAVAGADPEGSIRVHSGATLEVLQSWRATDPAFVGADFDLIEIAAGGDLDGDGRDELLVGVPGAPGGGVVLALTLGPIVGSGGCVAATANSTGDVGRLHLSGSLTLASDDLTLGGSALPPVAFVLPLASQTTSSVPMAGGTPGTLCLGGEIVRLNALIRRSSQSGTFSASADLAAWPTSYAVSAHAGETWSFQLWHRDVVGGAATANFSDTRTVTLQ